jgi:hypothetical protein
MICVSTAPPAIEIAASVAKSAFADWEMVIDRIHRNRHLHHHTLNLSPRRRTSHHERRFQSCGISIRTSSHPNTHQSSENAPKAMRASVCAGVKPLTLVILAPAQSRGSIVRYSPVSTSHTLIVRSSLPE